LPDPDPNPNPNPNPNPDPDPNPNQVLKAEHGDIFIYNGAQYHGTTEFHIARSQDSRVFYAFYVSVGVLRGAITSSVVHSRRGMKPKIFV